MPSGVYRIEIGPNFYYGSSVNLDRRRAQHLSPLKRGIHYNVRLQRAWNKYGSWSFTVVEECDDILSTEQRYLDEHFGHARCMNLVATAGSPLGYRHTPEALAKMRVPKPPEQVARMYGNTYGAAHKGVKMTPEAVETNRRAHTGLTYSEESKIRRQQTWERKRAEGYVSPNKGRPKPSSGASTLA